MLTADVLVPEIWGNGKTKDYPLWYWAGQQVLSGGNLYPADLGKIFEFIYPPLPAVLLAPPAWFGKIPLYLCLSLLNAAAWWMVGQLSNAMTGSGRIPGPWLFALPSFATITFIFDQFDLGQPNLMLLAMMLYGFWLLQRCAAVDGRQHVCARYRHQGLSGGGAALSGVAEGVEGNRQHARLPRPVPVRAAGAVSRFRAQCGGAEDLVSRHGRHQLGEGIWPARRAELVVGQSVDHRGDAPPAAAGQLQSGRSVQAAAHHECRQSRLQDRELCGGRDLAC